MTPGPPASMTPAASTPIPAGNCGRVASSEIRRRRQLSPTAMCRTRTWPGPGSPVVDRFPAKHPRARPSHRFGRLAPWGSFSISLDAGGTTEGSAVGEDGNVRQERAAGRLPRRTGRRRNREGLRRDVCPVCDGDNSGSDGRRGCTASDRCLSLFGHSPGGDAPMCPCVRSASLDGYVQLARADGPRPGGPDLERSGWTSPTSPLPEGGYRPRPRRGCCSSRPTGPGTRTSALLRPAAARLSTLGRSASCSARNRICAAP